MGVSISSSPPDPRVTTYNSTVSADPSLRGGSTRRRTDDPVAVRPPADAPNPAARSPQPGPPSFTPSGV